MTSPSSKNSHKHLSKPCDNSFKLNSSSKSKKVCNYSASNSINLSRNRESNKVKNTYKVADVIELSSSDENTADESARKIELVPSYKKQPKSVSNRLTKQQSHSSSSKVLADSEKTPQSKVLRNAQHKKFRKKVHKSTQNLNYSSDSDDSPVNAKKVIRNKLVRRTVRSVSSDSYASDYDNIDTRKKFGERVLQVNRTLTNLKKTKQPCIQGEVSSTTFPDIHIPTPDQPATNSVQCPQSSLEVHSSSNLQDFQNGREVGSGVLQILKTPSPDIREKVFMTDPNRPNLSTMTYTDYESLYRDMVRAEQKSVERPCIANFNSNLNYHRELLPYECGPLRLRNFQPTFPISPRESNVDGETKKLNDGSAVRNETVTKEKIEDSDKSTSLCATSSNQLPFLKKSLANRTELGVSAIGRKSISQKDKFIQTENEDPLHTSVPCSTPLETTTSTADIENTQVEGITPLLTKQTELVTPPCPLAISKSPNKEINSVLSSTCGIEEKIKSTSCSPSLAKTKSSTQPNNTKRNNAKTIAPSIEEVRTEILPLQHSHIPENIEIEACSSTLTSKDLSVDDCLSVSINDNVNSSNQCVEQSFPLESNKSLEISCKNQQIAKDDSSVCNEHGTQIIETQNKQKNANYLRVKDVSALQCPVEKSKNIGIEASLPSSEVQISPKNSTKSLEITNNTPTQTSFDKEIKQNFSIEIKNRMEMLIEEEICNVELDEYGDSIGAEEENALLCEDESILKENNNPVEPTHTDNQIAMEETAQELTKKCESDFNSVDATENDKTEAFLRILDKCLEEDTLQGDMVAAKESSSCLEIEKVGELLPLSYSSCATDKPDTNSSSCTKKDKICAQSVTVGDLQNKDEIFSPKETFSVELKGEAKDHNEQKNKQQNNVCNIIATPSKDSEKLRYTQTDESKEKHEEWCAKIQTVTNDDMKKTCEKQMSPLKESSTVDELATMVVESCGESKGVIPDTQEKSTNDEETNSQAVEAICSVQQTSNDDSEESISGNNDSLKQIETNENVQEVISEVEPSIKDDECVAKTDSLFMSEQTVALIDSEPKQKTTTNSDLSFDHEMTIASTENASMYEEQNISRGNKDGRKDSCESEKSFSTSTCAMDNILEQDRSVNEQLSSLIVNIEIEEKSKETVDGHCQDPVASTEIDEKVQKTCSDTNALSKTLSDACIEISVENGISAREKPKVLLEDESKENNKERFARVEAVDTGIRIAIEEEVSIDDQRGNALMCCEINENFKNVSYEVEIDALSNVNTAVTIETNHVFASELPESIVEETSLNKKDGKSTAESDSEIAALSLEKEESISTPVMTRENIEEDKNDDREKENKHIRNCDDDNKHEESFPSHVLTEKQIHVVETTEEHLDESISKISSVLDDSCGETQKTQDENCTIETEFDKAVIVKIKVTSQDKEFCDKETSTKEEDGAILLHENENKDLIPKDIDDETTTCASDNVVDTVLASTSNSEKNLTVGENNDQLMKFQTCGDSSKSNLEEQSEVQNVIVQISKHETEPSQNCQTNFPQMTVEEAEVQCIHNELSVSHLYGEISEDVEQNKEISAENMETTTETETFCQNETLKSIQQMGELQAKDSNEDNGDCKIKAIIPDIATEQTVETDVSCAATEVRDTECVDRSEVEVFDYSVEDNNSKVSRKLTVIEYGKKVSQLLAENVDQNPAYSSVIVEKIEEANETITEVNRCKEFENNFPDDKEEQKVEDVNPEKQTKTNNTVMPEYAKTEEIEKQDDFKQEDLDKIGTKTNDECTSLKIIEENTEIVQNENQNSAREEFLMVKQSETRIEATVEQDLTKQHDVQGKQEENATEDNVTISLKSSKKSANLESITESSDAPDALQNISSLQNRPTVLTTIASCAAENDTREREFLNFSKDDSDKKLQVDTFKLSFDQKIGNDFSSRCERDYLGKIGKAVRQSGGSMNKMLTHDKISVDVDQSKLCSIEDAIACKPLLTATPPALDENSGKVEEQPKDGCSQFNSEFICPSNDVCSNFFLRSKKSIPNEKALIKSPEENYERTPFKLRIKRRLSECANNLENLLNEDKCSPCKSNIPPTVVNDARSECEIFPIKTFASEPNKEEAPVEKKILTPEIDSNCENNMNNLILGVGRIKTDHSIKNNIKSSTIQPTSCNEPLSSDETEVDIEKQQVWMNKLGLRKKPNEKLPLTREESKEKQEKGRLNKLIISRRETTTSTGVVDTFTSRINAVAENTSDTTKKGETVSLGPSYNLTLLASEAEKLTPIVDAVSPTPNESSKSPRSGLRSGTTQSKKKGKSLRSTRNSCTEVEKEEIELNVRNALQVVQNKPKSALKNPNSKQRKERRTVTFADTLGVWKQKKMTEFLKLLRNSNGRLQLTSNLKDKLSEVLMILSEYSKEYDIRPSELCIKNEEFVVDMMFDEPELYKEEVSKKGLKTSKKIAPKKDIEQVIGELILKTLQKNKTLDQLAPPKIDYEQGMKIIQNSAVVEYIEPGTSTMQLDLVDDRDQPTLHNEDTQKIVDDSSELSLIIKTPASKRGRKPKINNQKSATANDKKCDDIKSKKIVGGNKKQSASLNLSQLLYPASEAMARSKDQFADITVISDHESSDESLSDYLYKTNQYLNAVLDNKPLDLKNNSLNVRDTARNAGKYVQSFPNATPLLSPNNFMSVSIGQCSPAQILDKKKTKKSSKKGKREAQRQEVNIVEQRTCENTKQVTSTVEAMANTVVTEAKFKTLLEPEIIIENASGNVNLNKREVNNEYLSPSNCTSIEEIVSKVVQDVCRKQSILGLSMHNINSCELPKSKSKNKKNEVKSTTINKKQKTCIEPTDQNIKPTFSKSKLHSKTSKSVKLGSSHENHSNFKINQISENKNLSPSEKSKPSHQIEPAPCGFPSLDALKKEGVTFDMEGNTLFHSMTSSSPKSSESPISNVLGPTNKGNIFWDIDGNILPFNLSLGTDNAIFPIKEDTKEEDISVKTDVSIKLCEDPINSQDSTESSSQNSTTNQLIDALVPTCERKSEKLVGSKKRKSKRCKQLTSDIIINKTSYNECLEGASKTTQAIVNKQIEPSEAASRTPTSNNGLDLIQPGAIRETPSDAPEISCIPHRILNNKKEGKIPSVRKSKKVGLLDMVEMLNSRKEVITTEKRETEEDENIFIQTKALDLSAKIKPQSELPQENTEMNTTPSANKNLLQEITVSNKEIFTPRANLEVADTSKSTCNELKTIDENVEVVADSMVCLGRKEDVNEVSEKEISTTPEKESLLESVSDIVSKDTTEPNTNKDEISVEETISDSTTNPMNTENQISMTLETESLLESVSASVSEDTVETNTNKNEIMVGETTSDSTISPMNAENQISMTPEKESLLDSVSDSVSKDTAEPKRNKDEIKVGETTSDSTAENQISMTPEKESLLDNVSDTVSEDIVEQNTNKDKVKVGETTSDSTISPMNSENQISMTPEKESQLESGSDSVSKDTAEPKTIKDEIKVVETTSDSTKSIMNTSCKNEEDEGETKMLDMDKMERKIPADFAEDQYDRVIARKELSGETYIAQTSDTNNEITENDAENVLRANVSNTEVNMESNQNAPILDERTYIIEDAINKEQSGQMEKPIDTEENQEDSKNFDEVTKNTETSEEPILNAVEVPINVVPKMPVATKASKKDMTQVLKIMETIKENEINQGDRKIEGGNKISPKIIDDTNLKSDSNMILTSNEISTDSQYPPEERKLKSIKLKITNKKEDDKIRSRELRKQQKKNKKKKVIVTSNDIPTSDAKDIIPGEKIGVENLEEKLEVKASQNESTKDEMNVSAQCETIKKQLPEPSCAPAKPEEPHDTIESDKNEDDNIRAVNDACKLVEPECAKTDAVRDSEKNDVSAGSPLNSIDSIVEIDSMPIENFVKQNDLRDMKNSINPVAETADENLDIAAEVEVVSGDSNDGELGKKVEEVPIEPPVTKASKADESIPIENTSLPLDPPIVIDNDGNKVLLVPNEVPEVKSVSFESSCLPIETKDCSESKIAAVTEPVKELEADLITLQLNDGDPQMNTSQTSTSTVETLSITPIPCSETIDNRGQSIEDAEDGILKPTDTLSKQINEEVVNNENAKSTTNTGVLHDEPAKELIENNPPVQSSSHFPSHSFIYSDEKMFLGKSPNFESCDLPENLLSAESPTYQKNRIRSMIDKLKNECTTSTIADEDIHVNLLCEKPQTAAKNGLLSLDTSRMEKCEKQDQDLTLETACTKLCYVKLRKLRNVSSVSTAENEPLPKETQLLEDTSRETEKSFEKVPEGVVENKIVDEELLKADNVKNNANKIEHTVSLNIAKKKTRKRPLHSLSDDAEDEDLQPKVKKQATKKRIVCDRWENEERLISKYTNLLQLKKMFASRLMQFLCTFERLPTLEVFFTFNKFLVTFIYETLSSEDYSTVSCARTYLHLCTKTKQLQSKNIDDIALDEIEQKYTLLKKKRNEFRSLEKIKLLDEFLQQFKLAKKTLFTDIWIRKNYSSIQRHLHMEPVELHFKAEIPENVEYVTESNEVAKILSENNESIQETAPNSTQENSATKVDSLECTNEVSEFDTKNSVAINKEPSEAVGTTEEKQEVNPTISDTVTIGDPSAESNKPSGEVKDQNKEDFDSIDVCRQSCISEIVECDDNNVGAEEIIATEKDINEKSPASVECDADIGSPSMLQNSEGDITSTINNTMMKLIQIGNLETISSEMDPFSMTNSFSVPGDMNSSFKTTDAIGFDENLDNSQNHGSEDWPDLLLESIMEDLNAQKDYSGKKKEDCMISGRYDVRNYFPEASLGAAGVLSPLIENNMTELVSLENENMENTSVRASTDQSVNMNDILKESLLMRGNNLSKCEGNNNGNFVLNAVNPFDILVPLDTGDDIPSQSSAHICSEAAVVNFDLNSSNDNNLNALDFVDYVPEVVDTILTSLTLDTAISKCNTRQPEIQHPSSVGQSSIGQVSVTTTNAASALASSKERIHSHSNIETKTFPIPTTESVCSVATTNCTTTAGSVKSKLVEAGSTVSKLKQFYIPEKDLREASTSKANSNQDNYTTSEDTIDVTKRKSPSYTKPKPPAPKPQVTHLTSKLKSHPFPSWKTVSPVKRDVQNSIPISKSETSNSSKNISLTFSQSSDGENPTGQSNPQSKQVTPSTLLHMPDLETPQNTTVSVSKRPGPHATALHVKKDIIVSSQKLPSPFPTIDDTQYICSSFGYSSEVEVETSSPGPISKKRPRATSSVDASQLSKKPKVEETKTMDPFDKLKSEPVNVPLPNNSKYRKTYSKPTIVNTHVQVKPSAPVVSVVSAVSAVGSVLSSKVSPVRETNYTESVKNTLPNKVKIHVTDCEIIAPPTSANKPIQSSVFTTSSAAPVVKHPTTSVPNINIRRPQDTQAIPSQSSKKRVETTATITSQAKVALAPPSSVSYKVFAYNPPTSKSAVAQNASNRIKLLSKEDDSKNNYKRTASSYVNDRTTSSQSIYTFKAEDVKPKKVFSQPTNVPSKTYIHTSQIRNTNGLETTAPRLRHNDPKRTSTSAGDRKRRHSVNEPHRSRESSNKSHSRHGNTQRNELLDSASASEDPKGTPLTVRTAWDYKPISTDEILEHLAKQKKLKSN